jgi:hypothetical protein
MEAAALVQFERLCAIHSPVPQHRVPLGLLMLSRGYVNEGQLQTVLSAQREAGSGKLGNWALKLEFVTERQLLNTLSVQWSCPVLALQTPPDLACAELLPWNLLRSLRMMPVRFIRSTRLLYMAVCEELEHAALAAIEQVIHCRVVPCLVSDRAMDRWLADESPRKAPRVLVFEKTSGATEMARITSSYAGRLGADEVQIVRCGRYAWVRLNVAHKNSDLLFNLDRAGSENGSCSVGEFAAVG